MHTPKNLLALIALMACNVDGPSKDVSDATLNGAFGPANPHVTTDGTLTDTSDTGESTTDRDGDGFSEADGDCDDGNPDAYPGAEELCNNVDDNCSGVVDEGMYMCEWSDNDFDHFTPNGGDCDDYNPDANPGETEECNGFDDDCDGEVDESHTTRVAGNECGDVDFDGDGVLTPTDCNDSDPTIFPGASDIPYNGIDENCSGADLTDVDRDGVNAIVAAGTDCDDNDPDRFPGNPEVLNDGIDNDCDPATLDLDADFDGVTTALGDCNDLDDTIFPAAPELCDGLDNDCDLVTDENIAQVSWYLDADGDLRGDEFDLTPVLNCAQPVGRVANNDDCDDSDPAINPTVAEIPYNAVDEDCDGKAVVDVDCDTYAPPLDCDDNQPLAFPFNPEIANDGIDNDCDPATPDIVVNADSDGDGSLDTLDCADADPLRFPGATEVANDGIDQDCDGSDLVVVMNNQLCVTVNPSVTGNVNIYLFETQSDPLGASGQNRTYWVDQLATNPVVGTPFMNGDASSPICGDMTLVPYTSGDRVLLLAVNTDGVEQPLVTGDTTIGFTSLVSGVTLDAAPVVNFSNSESACAAPYDCTDCIMP